MSDKPEAAAGDAPPAKSKKKLLIIIIAVLVLAIGGGAAFFLMSKKKAAAAAEGGEEGAPAAHQEAPPPPAAHADTKAVPPTYLPMDNMVVNLADPDGEHAAQIGVILVVADAHASDTVKAYLPMIRSGVMLLIAQRTSEELRTAEGKEKLIKGILREASVPFGGGDDDEEDDNGATKKKKKRRAHVQYPVTDVLFSSFIIQ